MKKTFAIAAVCAFPLLLSACGGGALGSPEEPTADGSLDSEDAARCRMTPDGTCDGPVWPDPDECQPTNTCGNRECGMARDTCGNSYHCGTCGEGEQCSAGSCIPLSECNWSVACRDVECGAVATPCAAVYCGDCTRGEACVAGACEPMTCEDDDPCNAQQCGTALDACGNAHECGHCSVGFTCEQGSCEPKRPIEPIDPTW